jgi:hypothetical protein
MPGFELFAPFGSNTTSVSVSNTHAEGTLNFPSSSSDLSGSSRTSNWGDASVRVYNSASVTVFIQFGSSTVAATTSHMPVPPGAVEVFQVGPSVTTISAITSSGSGTLYATTGRGA